MSERVALIIGSGNYASASKLPNAVNDADDIETRLKRFGFVTQLVTDVTTNNLTGRLTPFDLCSTRRRSHWSSSRDTGSRSEPRITGFLCRNTQAGSGAFPESSTAGKARTGLIHGVMFGPAWAVHRAALNLTECLKQVIFRRILRMRRSIVGYAAS
ncbi:caspase family protein [Granulicella arctica]|uniref:caspase family protein n=1 Tax=Granulicella arctica TaxID=940613 RepID=UPI0015CD6C6E